MKIDANGRWWNLEPLQCLGSFCSLDRWWCKADLDIEIFADVYVNVDCKEQNNWRWLYDTFKTQVETSFKNIRTALDSQRLSFERSAEENMSFTSPTNPNVLCDHMASTCAFLHFHFQYIEVVRTVELKNKMFERMCSLTTTVLQFQHALSMHPVRLESVSEWTNVSIFISAHVEVCNLIYALKTRYNHLCNVVESIWRVLYSEYAVQQPWEHLSEVVPLSDLFAFTALGARTKKKRQFEGQWPFELTASHFAFRSDWLHVLCNRNFCHGKSHWGYQIQRWQRIASSSSEVIEFWSTMWRKSTK